MHCGSSKSSASATAARSAEHPGSFSSVLKPVENFFLGKKAYIHQLKDSVLLNMNYKIDL